MDTFIQREGDLGVVVCFRLEDTNELLWKSPMQVLPGPDDTVVLLDAEGGPATYKVEGVKFEFLHETLTVLPPGGPPQGSTHDLAWHGICVFVSAV
jgi:hypothetical protein